MTNREAILKKFGDSLIADQLIEGCTITKANKIIVKRIGILFSNSITKSIPTLMMRLRRSRNGLMRKRKQAMRTTELRALSVHRQYTIGVDSLIKKGKSALVVAFTRKTRGRNGGVVIVARMQSIAVVEDRED